jgi:hypothetical protein
MYSVIPGRRTDLGFTRDRHLKSPGWLKPTWVRRTWNPEEYSVLLDSGFASFARAPE